MPTQSPPTPRARSPRRPAGAGLIARLFRAPAHVDADDLVAGPIRGELLGADQLAERARLLARSQRAVVRRRLAPARLLSRLRATDRLLDDAQARLLAAFDAGVDVGPAGEWLLDNYHVVREHIVEVNESLPGGYYRELPELSRGTLAGYPRVYELAIALISHSEGRVDLDNIDLFVAAYQEVSPLLLGELWAMPAMLRLGLIESVRRSTLRTVQRLDDVERADAWAHRIQEASEQGADALGEALRDFVGTSLPLTPVFTTRFLTQLRLAAGAFPPLVWLESWMAEEGLGAEEASARATQRTALTQLMMANSITSLRAIGHSDWRAFVERQSVVERVLARDPSGVYARQTFDTRDRYRHVVESIAKRRRLSETEVASVAIDLARDAQANDGEDPRRAHVGYYLIDRGLADLESATDYVPTVGESLARAVRRHPNVVYFGGMAVLSAAAIAALFWLAGPVARLAWPLVLLLGVVPAVDIAINVLHQLVTVLMPPNTLPKLDLKKNGIPPEARTAVVVPTLFANVEAVQDALAHLEVQYLANRKEGLVFALLSDFTDAASEHGPADAAIIAVATEGVTALNARYGTDGNDVFALLHRPRRWNAVEGTWMGWERKRGKLAEFNRFLRGERRDAFSTIVGADDGRALRAIRYVITLDSDTVLPPDVASTLIGTIAHPLNIAQYDQRARRVVRGYGIVQPRVGVSLPSAHQSRFAVIHSGHPGVDPYTTAVSDVFQDLYGEGSFTGKGIYDVDAFEQATHGRFPENTLLSHDLIEGNYARAGLATDVIVYDEYPSRYHTYTRRKHRWIRGDWQLLPWLTSRVPGPDGPERNRLPPLSKWKILDNLRRSTVEIAQLLLLIAGWTILPGSPLRWTLLGLGAIAAPWIAALLLALVRPPLDKSWRAYYAAVLEDARTSAQQLGQAIAFLPHQAWISADAIVRTLHRTRVSHRFLLEWQTASQAERGAAATARDSWRAMWPAVALSVAILAMAGASIAVRASAQGELSAGTFAPGEGARLWQLAVTLLPLAAVWALSPALAHALSQPGAPDERRVAAAGRDAGMRYALLHWRFFERFATADTQWLAPDNYQDDPSPVVAMRTSPTNIGLQLLSTVSARDLGFITIASMTERLELAFRSLERMARFRGHLYNWYDLHDLRVLEPAYVSTVDSGNLAGHLIALRQACLGVLDEPLVDAGRWDAVDAALALAHASLRTAGARAASRSSADAAAAVRAARDAIGALGRHTTRAGARAATGGPRGDDAADHVVVASALQRAHAALTAGRSLPDEHAEALVWVDWSLALLDAHREELRALGVAGEATRAGSDGATTLRARAAHSPLAASLVARLEALAERAYDDAMAMDFRFLFDGERELFSIGYQLATHARDVSSYDLLASEARLASFIAIAKDDVPVDHWFRLGRTLTRASGETALISWSGSMFEYLMPALVMQSFPSTLLDQTYRAAVRRQVAYATQRGVPWGVSESAYNLRDRHLTYQYRAFGIPDLSLKRGLGRDLVIAPYATLLAAMIDLPGALENLALLEENGALGAYGFRDALDYTRPDPNRRCAVVQSYMAHHIGMSLVALANVLRARVWQRRFHADPLVQSAELLLHERVPRRLVLQEPQEAHPDEALPDPDMERSAVREMDTPDTPQPQVALLGFLPYTVMVSHGGSGYSRYEELAVTRWRSDGTTDNTGQFCYVRSIGDGRVWSTAHQPTGAAADWYRAILATDRVTFHRADGEIETRTEIAVVPEDAAEVRRVTVTNNGSTTREVELTSYGEIVLGPVAADRAHPAFANLFVQTEWHEWCTALTATRRPRSASEPALHCVHVVNAPREQVGEVSYETDRARFIGRGRSTREPWAMQHAGPLAGHTGAVLDPIFALRVRVRLDPGRSSSVTFTTLVATTRERAFALAGRYHDPHAGQRALDLTWTTTQIELRELNVTPADAAVFQEIAGHLLYSDHRMRASTETLLRNRGSQPRLWTNGISGDWPILLATIDTAAGVATLRQLFAAHRYWRRRGLTIDLVIVNSSPHTYLQDLNDRITETMFSSSDSAVIDRPGGVFLRRRSLMEPDDLLMLEATARMHVRCDGRSLGQVLDAAGTHDDSSLEEREPDMPVLRPSGRSTPPSLSVVQRFNALRTPPTLPTPVTDSSPAIASREAALRADARRVAHVARRDAGDRGERPSPLRFDNGYGGMTPTGDYEIIVTPDRRPPAPWVNVVANPHGGFLVSESGAGYTWAENSYFYRLTPWANDPVSDPAGEVLYLRDDETGDTWSATPAPIHREGAFTVRHAPGRSSFIHEHDEIGTELTMSIAAGAAVKLSSLRVTNHGATPRRLTLVAYVEWTLGVMREHTQHQVVTSYVASDSALYARNHFDPQFAEWVAFLATDAPVECHTGDRREFIGRNGTLAAPAALLTGRLGNVTGAAIDPCGALQCRIDLAPGETRAITVILGAAAGEREARAAVETYRGADAAAASAATTSAEWERRLSVIRVRTPEPSFDAMVNRWTLYQALACRMWARSALYQSSGAYGFRDQLQDVMAFVYAEPEVARAHILRAAARQFLEGDVQHWWHPQSGRGVRTRFSDDLAWLPFVVEHYVRVTGDVAVLDAYVPFLSMRHLGPDEHELYDLPTVTDEHGSIYEHCLRALRRACTVGAHGLPLIGIGDWNDGMNRVGVGGKGESVWLAWFLATTLRRFVPLAQSRGDVAVAAEFTARAAAYVEAVEANAWDGAWYRRAYFDDGAPLGSASSEECRIDSIAQSWSVISGAGAPDRQREAMASVERHLVRDDARLLMLLTPPFDKTPNDPGYIRGYLPGVRENGAQYTHAALWVVLATAMRGDGDRAFALYQMINPLTHADSPAAAAEYKVEPYVVAADVYTAEGQLGRGGWTWYTGSASWMYRVAVESILGFRKEGERLTIEPCIPSGWREFGIEYTFGASVYAITVRNPDGVATGVASVTLDGETSSDNAIQLVDDGRRREVVVTLG